MFGRLIRTLMPNRWEAAEWRAEMIMSAVHFRSPKCVRHVTITLEPKTGHSWLPVRWCMWRLMTRANGRKGKYWHSCHISHTECGWIEDMGQSDNDRPSMCDSCPSLQSVRRRWHHYLLLWRHCQHHLVTHRARCWRHRPVQDLAGELGSWGQIHRRSKDNFKTIRKIRSCLIPKINSQSRYDNHKINLMTKS